MASESGADRQAADAAHLTAREHRDARHRTSPAATVVFEAIRLEAEDELARTNRALFFSGLAAGLSMGFSFIAEALLLSGIPAGDWRPLLSKLGYSVGFVLVILGRQQLFTENSLTPVLELLHKKTWSVAANTLRLWGVVLLANMLGTLLFALVLSTGVVLSETPTAALHQLAGHVSDSNFSLTLVRAIFAGWLIALMVWLLPFAETARLAVIILLTYLIAVGGFPHIIAGSTGAFYAVLQGITPLPTALYNFFLPTLLGNMIGGIAMVAVLNYAQTAPATE